MQQKLLDNDFTLEDFRDQLKSLRKLGPLENLLKMMPDMGIMKELKERTGGRERNDAHRAIIDSMTPKERANHMLINGTGGAGSLKGPEPAVQDVKQSSQAVHASS